MDYKNGKIYKIIDNAYTKMYIGSTAQPLSKRFSNHKAKYKVWQCGKGNKVSVYTLFNEFGIENCKIELIEDYACNSRNELEKKEGEHIKNNECVNKLIVGRDIKEAQKEYKENNKDKIKQISKKWYKLNKDKVNSKEYRELNKDKIKEAQKKYRELNKDKILEKQKEKIICDCGKEYTKQNKLRHYKSKKHIKFTLIQ